MLNDKSENEEPQNSYTTNVLETKLAFLEKENSILHLDLENKHKTIDSLLENNNSLFKFIRDPSSLSFKILPPQIVRNQMVCME